MWFLEPKLRFGDVLSKSGLENIANHKYVAGSYTALDTALNPLWVKLTDMLPLWLAPNAVTTVGGLHCGLAYYVLWQHSPNFDQPVPDWVLFLAGYCTIACECYYIHTYIHTCTLRMRNAECRHGQLANYMYAYLLSPLLRYLLILSVLPLILE